MPAADRFVSRYVNFIEGLKDIADWKVKRDLVVISKETMFISSTVVYPTLLVFVSAATLWLKTCRSGVLQIHTDLSRLQIQAAKATSLFIQIHET